MRTVLATLIMVGLAVAAPAPQPRAPLPRLLSSVTLPEELQRLVEEQVKPEAAAPRSVLEGLLAILHYLGYTDFQIIKWALALPENVVYILSQLPAPEVMAVELAAGDVLGMIQRNDASDVPRIQQDLTVVVTLMKPYMQEGTKQAIQEIIDLINTIQPQ